MAGTRTRGTGRRRYVEERRRKVRIALPLLREKWAKGAGQSRIGYRQCMNVFGMTDNEIWHLRVLGVLPEPEKREWDTEKHFDLEKAIKGCEAYLRWSR